MKVVKTVTRVRTFPALSPGILVALVMGIAMSIFLLSLVVLRGTPPVAALWMRGTSFFGLQPTTRSPLNVARCRASCLKQFSAQTNKDHVCLDKYDCYTCWHDCELLEATSSGGDVDCTNRVPCLDGCRAACRFLGMILSEAPPAQPVLETKAALLESEGLELQWPCSVTSGAVHVLLWKARPRDNWTQLKQTTECFATLPKAGSARVLSVEASGLTAIYTPSATTGSAELAEEFPEAAGPGKPMNGSQWSLRLSSVIHQGAVVIAELSWRTPDTDLELARKKGTLLYLVTWEVDGGGITGNLYTDSSCVTLSLSADTVFHIQVELVLKAPSGPSRSPRLLVDTGGGFADGSLIVVLPSSLRAAGGMQETTADRLTVVVIIVVVALTMSLISFAGSWYHQKKCNAVWDMQQLFVQPPPVKKAEVREYDIDFRLSLPD